MIRYEYIYIHITLHDYNVIYDCIYILMWLLYYDYVWSRMIMYDYIWFRMIIYDHITLYIIVYYIWLYFDYIDYIWLYMMILIIYDYMIILLYLIIYKINSDLYKVLFYMHTWKTMNLCISLWKLVSVGSPRNRSRWFRQQLLRFLPATLRFLQQPVWKI